MQRLLSIDRTKCIGYSLMRGIKPLKVTKQLREVVSSLGVAEEIRVKYEFRRLE